MRLKVTKSGGLTLPGGKARYAFGEEFDLPDDRRGKLLANVLQARKYVKKWEPVILGTAPPPVEPPAPEPPPPTPGPEQPAETWAQPPWLEPEEKAAPQSEETETETGAEPAEGEATEEGETAESPRRRGRPPIHGRYSRRDLRSEE